MNFKSTSSTGSTQNGNITASSALSARHPSVFRGLALLFLLAGILLWLRLL
jgi:hypothetical protein